MSTVTELPIGAQAFLSLALYLPLVLTKYMWGESRVSTSFLKWFLKFMLVFMGAISSGTALNEIVFNKPFYMPMEVLGMFGALFMLLYASSILLDSFFSEGYSKDWIILYAFCTIISAGSYGNVNEQAHNVLSMSLALSIVQGIKTIIMNQFTPDETGDPKALKWLNLYVDKVLSIFAPKATNG